MRRLIAPLAALLVALTFALPTGGVAMAATTTALAPTQVSANTGLNTYGGAHGFAITAGALAAIVDTAGVTPGVQFHMDTFWSQDNGKTWTLWDSFDFTSDPGVDKQGNPITTHNVGGSDWPGSRMQIQLTSSAACTITVSANLFT